MSAPGIRDVVCNLLGCGKGRANVVPADWSEVRSIGENDARKSLVRRMVRNVYALVATHLKAQPLKSCGTFNSKVRGKNRVSVTIAELIQKPAGQIIIIKTKKLRSCSESTSLGNKGLTTFTVRFLRLKRVDSAVSR